MIFVEIIEVANHVSITITMTKYAMKFTYMMFMFVMEVLLV